MVECPIVFVESGHCVLLISEVQDICFQCAWFVHILHSFDDPWRPALRPERLLIVLTKLHIFFIYF